MALVVGKQSNLNDLSDLKTDLEAKIEEAKLIKVGEVSQIEGGVITGGSIYDHRPKGIYYSTEGDSMLEVGGGMTLEMGGASEESGVKIHVRWAGEVSVFTKFYNGQSIEKAEMSLLTSKNTITDSNGFIKAA